VRHRRKRGKLGRAPAHRKATIVNLACSLIEHGRVVTSPQKAKAAKPFVEKMITLGKRGDLKARRSAIRHLCDRKISPGGKQMRVVKRLFNEIAPMFAEPSPLARQGGYTRIIRLPRTIRLSANETYSQWRKAYGLRLGDGGEQVYFELVGYQPPTYEEEEGKAKGKGKGKEEA
jgi:large subunit ribosomal protein L17